MYLDRNEAIEIYYKGNLPHMHQDGKLQYVTFRLADSLPQSKCAELHQRVNDFKSKHPEPWDPETKLLYWKEIGPMQQQYLDNGYGACWLRYPECRKILMDTIAYKDNVTYEVGCYVIMPNHVHILMRPLGENKLEDILHSIKRYSAVHINRLIGRSGKFWMKESFDRLVRSEDDHKRYYHYILDNPRFLPPGSFAVYVRD